MYSTICSWNGEGGVALPIDRRELFANCTLVFLGGIAGGVTGALAERELRDHREIQIVPSSVYEQGILQPWRLDIRIANTGDMDEDNVDVELYVRGDDSVNDIANPFDAEIPQWAAYPSPLLDLITVGRVDGRTDASGLVILTAHAARLNPGDYFIIYIRAISLIQKVETDVQTDSVSQVSYWSAGKE